MTSCQADTPGLQCASDQKYPALKYSFPRNYSLVRNTQEKETAESAERRRGAAVITAQLVERQEARLAAEAALKQASIASSHRIPAS